MKKSLAVFAFSSVLASSCLSAATLHVPMAFEFLALNGQKIGQNLVVHQSELDLKPGYHEIAVRYYDMVVLDLDYEEEVSSAAFIITLNVTDDVDYYLEPVGGSPVRDPEGFASAPNIAITRKDGGAVDYKFTQTDITQKEFKTRLYSQSTQQPQSSQPVAAVVVTEPSGLAPVEEDVPSSPSLTSTSVSAAEAGETNATPEQMLRMWWQRADEATRKEFLSWAIKNL